MKNELKKLSTTCYYDNYGYYMLGDDKSWLFLPQEKMYSSNNLLDIMNTLKILNET